MRASACQPRLRSPEINGSSVKPWLSGLIEATSGSDAANEGNLSTVSSQFSIFPPSLNAPPITPRLPSIKYSHKPNGGVTCSGGNTTRIALDVPTVSDQFSVVAHPEPTQAAAPSPVAGNQGTSRRTDQPEACSLVSP